MSPCVDALKRMKFVMNTTSTTTWELPDRHRYFGWLIALLWLCCIGTLQAQNRNIDVTAPIIEVEELTESQAGSSQLFTAQVVDDQALMDVVLYHRREGQSAYQRRFMSSTGLSGVFSVAINTEPSDLRAIEYYIQARDENGNRTVSAFAFDPYRRVLQPRQEPVIETTPIETAPLETTPALEQPLPLSNGNVPFYKRRWFQIGLGVLAVGAIASQLNEDDDADRNIVPVTINVQ